jgi:hypothetical protein
MAAEPEPADAAAPAKVARTEPEPAKPEPAVAKPEPAAAKPEPAKPEPAVAKPEPAKPEPPAAITTRSLTAIYVEVGEALERLSERKGAAAAAALRARYRQIAFQDALRKPPLRREVDRKLRSLRREVTRALK